jgi:hypothetical protein
MLKMHFSMARNFTLQPLRRYDAKPPEKRLKRNLTFDAPCLQKTNQHTLGANLGSQPDTLPMRHTFTKLWDMYVVHPKSK